MEYNLRDVDYDLNAALKYNDLSHVIDEIEGVVAEVPGEADGPNWHWICKRKSEENPIAYVTGGCDYTGWGWQSFCDVVYAQNLESALKEVKDEEVREQLYKQIQSEQPFGTRIYEPPSKNIAYSDYDEFD